jgi:hypothetical protein
LIQVNRHPVPKVLERNSERWLKKLKLVIEGYKALELELATKKLLDAKKLEIEKVQACYRHEQVKTALGAMFGNKCAYCEAKILHISWGDIEHYYPKAIYIDKTFEWENMVLSCQRCNSAKGVQFPVASSGEPLLIHPADGITDPATHLVFDWDEVAKTASIYGRDERGTAVEKVFSLNRKELLEHRSKSVKRLAALLKFAIKGEEDALSLLQEACQADQEYAAFARVLTAKLLSHDQK